MPDASRPDDDTGAPAPAAGDRPLAPAPASALPIGPVPLLLASVVVAAATLHPPRETSLTVCVLRRLTGVPCPGCGMTRSLSHTIRGQLAGAFDLHPFGPLLLAAAVTIVALNLLPGPARGRVSAWLDRRAGALRLSALLLAAAFLLHGLLRAIGP